MNPAKYDVQDILDFWFPDDGHQNSLEAHGAFWEQRMQGGMDAAIIDRFSELTLAAARGELDHWSETPRGRLALMIVLDQFPRSLWRDTPAAYAQDIKATRLALEGLENGDFDELAPWEKNFVVIAVAHCEGPDHLERMNRMDDIVEGIADSLPEPISRMADGLRAQHARTKAVIATFGRHPHRNRILGRPSTPEEEAYIAKGDFPHVRRPNPGN